MFYSRVHLRFEKLLLNEYVMLCYANRTVRYRETICPTPVDGSSTVAKIAAALRPSADRIRSPRISGGRRWLIAKFHYTGPTGPDQTKSADFVGDKKSPCGSVRVRAGPCGSARVRAGPCGSARVRAGPCGSVRVRAGPVGSGRDRVVEFSLSCKQPACLEPRQLRHGTDRRTDRGIA